jgi:hypothetical protein
MEGIALGAGGSTCLILSTSDGAIIIGRGTPKHSEKNLLQSTLTTTNPR